MDYFEKYPADPDEVIGIAASMRSSASDVDNTLANVTAEGNRAAAAVEGELSFPLAVADRPVIETGTDVVATARFAAGALLLFSTGITTFNTRVDELNASLPSGAPNWDEAIAPQRRQYEAAKGVLDEVAQQVAGMLDRGPNDADIAPSSTPTAYFPAWTSTTRRHCRVPSTSQVTTSPTRPSPSTTSVRLRWLPGGRC